MHLIIFVRPETWTPWRGVNTRYVVDMPVYCPAYVDIESQEYIPSVAASFIERIFRF